MSVSVIRIRLVVAIALVGAIGAVPAARAALRPGERVTRVTSVTFGYVDRPGRAHAAGSRFYAPAVVTVRDASGRVLSRHPTAPTRVDVESPARAQAAAGQIGCRFSWLRRGFTACSPLHFSSPASKAYYWNYRVFPYSQMRARRLGTGNAQYRTKQYEDCSTGGGDTGGGNRLTRAVSAMSREGADSLIDNSWGTKASNGQVDASLSFEVQLGPVKISGTDFIHPQGTLGGSIGGDKDLELSPANINNEVNAFWESPAWNIFQGSTHFEGNVGQALYEYPMSAPTGAFSFWANDHWICGHLFGIGCASA